MAEAFAKVLQAQGRDFQVMGRGEVSAKAFEANTGIVPIQGGVQLALQNHTPPSQAIIATSVATLEEAARSMIESGVKHLLLEKPGGLSFSGLRSLEHLAKAHGAQVSLAYNRRFFTSVQKARELLAEDGGPVSAQFEFTEWGHVIQKVGHPSDVLRRWFLVNPTHIVDMFFYLCGKPTELSTFQSGGNDWHPSATKFVGAGVTERDVTFSYCADWDAPGRWGLEVSSATRRFIFRPIEKLSVVHKGTVKLEPVELNDTLDQDFKPGIFNEVKAFLGDGDSESLCSLTEHCDHLDSYQRISGYSDT